MKKWLKILIIILVALLVIVLLLWQGYSITYDKYGFLFSLSSDEQYAVQLSGFDINEDGRISYKPFRGEHTGINSRKLYKALKEAEYNAVKELNLNYGELVSIYRYNANGNRDENFTIDLLYDKVSQQLYLKWNRHFYVITKFEKARELIQRFMQSVCPSIQMGLVDENFFVADYFSLPNPNYVNDYKDYVNTAPVELNTEEEIIAHAQREVRENYSTAVVRREEYGNDRYMVRFSYLFEEDSNIYSQIGVIMSKDGITEQIIHSVSFKTRFIVG